MRGRYGTTTGQTPCHQEMVPDCIYSFNRACSEAFSEVTGVCSSDSDNHSRYHGPLPLGTAELIHPLRPGLGKCW